MGAKARSVFHVKCESSRSKEEIPNKSAGRMQKEHRGRVDTLFTHAVRRNMSPASYKFAQSGRAPQCRHGARQPRTLIETVGVVRATQRLSPDSNQLPSERVAALLKTACSAFDRPCLSGRDLIVNIVTCNSFKLELYIPTWYYSKMVYRTTQIQSFQEK